MKFYIRPILLTLLCQGFLAGLVACKTTAENERLARLGNIAITYVERRGVLGPTDAADIREAGVVILQPVEVTASK